MSNTIPSKLETCLVVDPICDFVPALYAVEKSPQINSFSTIDACRIARNS